MKTLFLASQIEAVASKIVKVGNFPKNKKLAFISTPAEGEDGDKS